MFAINLAGIVMLFAAAFVALVANTLGVPQSISAPAGVGLMVLLDFGYRLRNDATGRQKWLGRKTGGFLALGPTWIMGLVILALLPFGLLT